MNCRFGALQKAFVVETKPVEVEAMDEIRGNFGEVANDAIKLAAMVELNCKIYIAERNF